MSTVSPRHLVHRGVVEARGLFFPATVLNPADARQRILETWRTGSAVHQLDEGMVLLFPAGLRVDVHRAPGTPLVGYRSVVSAAPLDDDELDALGPPAGSVVVVVGGVACVRRVGQGTLVDPATWIAVDGVPVLQVDPLGAPPHVVVQALEPPAVNLRQRLCGVPAAASAQQQMVQDLRARTGLGKEERPSFLARLVESARGLFTKAPAQPSASTALQPVVPAPRPSVDVGHALRRWALRFLITSRIARVLGRRQAEYLARMMEMFESGNIDDALRHAVPLGDLPAEDLGDLSLGVPGPRQMLNITMGRVAPRGGGAIALSDMFMDTLRRTYRNAFQRLVMANRIDEAAFVLAELLQAHEEAVAFLEKHGRLELAAELAESRGLPPGLVVRQWFVAGNVERAISVARRHNAFADAVVRLERSDKTQAMALRLLWGHSLAASGHYSAAVEAVWPVEQGRRVAAAWLDRIVSQGGRAGAVALVRRLDLFPDDALNTRERILDLLRGQDDEDAAAREALMEAMVAARHPERLRALARSAVRALWNDAEHGRAQFTTMEFQRLIMVAEDGALRSDLPALPRRSRPSLLQNSGPLELTRDAGDRGAAPALDAFMLPDGRCAVALGEAGVRIFSRAGKTSAHIQEPAHVLVPSDRGDRMLALAPRGRACRVSLADLVEQRAQEWLTLLLTAYAPTYDGSTWICGVGCDLVALDALASREQALWRVPDVGPESRVSTVRAIARSDQRVVMLTGAAERWCWSYELPQLMLRFRQEVEPFFPAESVGAMAAGPLLAELAVVMTPAEHDAPQVWLSVFRAGSVRRQEFTRPREVPHAAAGQRPFSSIAVDDQWLACAWQTRSGICVKVLDVQQLFVRASVMLEGRTRVSLRLQDHLLLMADDAGTVTALSLPEGRLTRLLRIT